MTIEDYSFHDSTILEVREDTTNQSLDFYLDFPVDSENDIFEKRILRFRDVTEYSSIEIPFHGPPAILEIIQHGITKKTIGSDRNEMHIKRNKIEILTNAGNRIIEFDTFELLKQ